MFSRGYSNVVSKEVILSLTSHEAIAAKYFGVKTFPCYINSPYRDDKRPSLRFAYTNSGELQWMDFGTAESGDIFALLMKVYNLNFQRVLEKIYNEMNLFSSFVHRPSNRHYGKRANYFVEVKVRKEEDFDYEYWKTYGVIDFKKWNIFPISMFKYTNSLTGNSNVIKADKYSYAFYEHQNGKHSIKIYQPYNTETYKWFSGHSRDVMDLLNFLPKTGNHLILASSRKDAINIWNNCDIPSISPQGEGYILSDYIIGNLKERFNHIHVLYDNDFDKPVNTGQKNAIQLCEKYQLSNIVIPSSTNCKDPSDLFKTSKIIYKEVMQEILPKNPLKNFIK